MAVSMIGPKFYAWDRDGKPLAFGKVYTYKARTNAPQVTYQSEDAVVANTNPVILNGEGYGNIYLDGSYKVVVKDKDDNEIWTADPVTAQGGEEWVNCMTAAYLSSTTFKISGNVTDSFEVGRRIRIDNNAATYAYSTILSAVFAATDTTVTISDAVVTTGLVNACVSIVGSESIPNTITGVINKSTLNDAVTSTDIINGQLIRVVEREAGKGGGGMWAAVLSSTVTENTFNIVQCVGVPTLSLALQINEDGTNTTTQYGAKNDNSIDSLAAVSALFHGNSKAKIIVDGDHLLSGTDGLLIVNKIDVEFIGDGSFHFDVADGTTQTHYLTLDAGSNNSKIVNPVILQANASIRGTRPGINIRNTTGVDIYNPRVDGVTGAGVLTANSSDCNVFGGSVKNTLADGFHITSGSFNVQYIDVTSDSTGDDGLAIVSPVATATCLKCNISGISNNSSARGVALVGGTDCRLDVTSTNAALKGVFISRDVTFDTHGIINCKVDAVVSDSGQEGVAVFKLVDGLLLNAIVKNAGGRGVSIGDSIQPPKDVKISVIAEGSATAGLYIDNASKVTGSAHVMGGNTRGAEILNGSSDFQLTIFAMDNCVTSSVSQVFIQNTVDGSLDITSLDSRGVPLIANALQVSGTENLDINSLTMNQSVGGLVNSTTGQGGLTFPKRECGRVTSVELLDIADLVNTKDSYIDGKQCWDETTNQPLWKNGTNAGSAWITSAGVTVYTPA